MSRCKRGGSISDPAERRDGDDDNPSFFDGEELVDTFIAFVLSSMGLFYRTTFLRINQHTYVLVADRHGISFREKVVEVGFLGFLVVWYLWNHNK